ncbi:trace amine-associated receptor 13c-like [Clupea harengus]|uniref:Trace amine-associated receptor 13c-like n=1 Tax=Clupea harengus TaxID=7950 RepID=A0A6P8FK73_CLUHA|nr:trace amine-associated receptor 13c-like [Clupea harengus]
MEYLTTGNYCFPALNSSCRKDVRSPTEYFIMYIFFSLVSVSTVFLNLLVIISISHFKQLHTPTNLFILCLAVADLLVGLIVMPVEGIRLIETCWYFGDTFCYIFPYITFAVVFVSMNNIVFISVDRYIAVCKPLRYPVIVTLRKGAVCVFLTWYVSLVYSLIVLHEHLIHPEPRRACHGDCLIIINLPMIAFDLVFAFIVPCSIVIVLNLKIFCTAMQQAQAISLVTERVKAAKEDRMTKKSSSKAAKTIGILVTVYLLCYMPIFASLPFQGHFTSASLVANSLLWMSLLNSCINPIIYALFYPWFRITTKHIVTLAILDPASSYFNVYPEFS